MEKRIHFYVSRKNVLTWLMAFCMVCSAVTRIAIFGLKGSGDSLFLWSQIVLPVVAVVLYALIVLLNGKEQFYKTAIPVWMIAAYSGIWIYQNVQSHLITWLFWICLIFASVLYTEITAGMRARNTWLLFFIVATPLAIILYYRRGAGLAVLPDVLMLTGALLLVFALHVHPAGEYHPSWGDRVDGRKLRTLDPMSQISAYFMVNRNGSTNLFEESFEITNLDRYVRQKRREGLTDFGLTHVLLAAYVRGIAKYPRLNRFISGQKVYSRDEDIQYSMTIKKEMTVESPDTTIKVHFNPHDTVTDVYRKMNAAVETVKCAPEEDTGLDGLVANLNLIPSIVLKFTVWLLKLLDYFGLIPKFLLELSPFHASLYFTSMGSLGIRPVYHHLYDFGNLPVFGAFGCKRRANEVQDDGTVVQRKYIDMKFTLDERIADGYYYATFFKYYRNLLRHPEVLDNPPDEVNRDID